MGMELCYFDNGFVEEDVFNDIQTLGDLKQHPKWKHYAKSYCSVKDELRFNTLRGIKEGKVLFPGIHGYDETVIPRILNAVLARQSFILLGVRGQAKSRILRGLAMLLDEWVPAIAGCEIHDHPARPLCRGCKERMAQAGDETPITFIHREQRYIEKLATPDVTVADLIGDVDPIRAAHDGLTLSDERIIHYGLLPRSHRGIFAMNELPDLAPKVQVAMFNIMQEGDVQIKGFPVRLPVDVYLVFTANPEDYTARGKIITPLKDRIGSEIRTHYPMDRETGIAITRQEAWLQRDGSTPVEIPPYIEAVVEEIAFQARQNRYVDQRSGVSQRLPITMMELVASNAEQRACLVGEAVAVARMLDVYTSISAITGKIELEYEGEMRGAEDVAKSIVRQATRVVFDENFSADEFLIMVQWFEAGGSLVLPEHEKSQVMFNALAKIPGLIDKARHLIQSRNPSEAQLVSAAEFILEGLWSHKKISRHPRRGYVRTEVQIPSHTRSSTLSDPHIQ